MQRDKVKKLLRYTTLFIVFIIIFVFLSACVGIPEEANITVENIKASDEQISLLKSKEYEDLKVTVIDCEAAYSYKDEYDEIVNPKEGGKFICIYIKAENIGKQEKYLPGITDFYLLYIDSFIETSNIWEWSDSLDDKKPYSSESVMPGISREGWIFFEVPKDAKAEDILVAWKYDYGKYYFWEIPQPLKESKPESKVKEELPEETTITIGDTVPEIKGIDNLSITFLLCKENKTAVNGPYYNEYYYTFTSKPGMKFIIIIYELKNNGVREQETPYIDTGEIETDKGYFYSAWSPSQGIMSEEYNPRKSTEEEVVNLIGNSGGYEDLLPEESIKGCIVFEIPEDETPVKIDLSSYIPYLIKLTE